MTERIVRQFETGYQRTIVTTDAEGNHRWRRWPGQDRTSPATRPSPSVRRSLVGLDISGVRTALPIEGPASGVFYQVPGTQTAAGLALTAPEGDDLDRLATVLTSTARLIRRIQLAAPADVVATPPAGPARALAWIRTGRGPRAAADLHRLLQRSMGDRRWREVMRWCEDLTTPAPEDRLLHGAAGLGQVVLATGSATAALMIGEDLARGPADFDAGWLLGEILELRMIANAQGRHQVFPNVARAAFLEGLGRLDDPDRAGRAAIVRMLVHAHDFAAYVGWHRELLVHVDVLPSLIDAGGSDVLTSAW
ncbi:hypothetical protein ACH4E7_09810 [Kitasatospora sp. NPDC018058]|uniref:hypothetical protein n=1 Tax=Kitasatospora sp. NPDC018058 TaxID=3364025 RepID=UPI0037BF05AF